MAYSNNYGGGYSGELTTTSYGAQGGGEGGGFMAGSQQQNASQSNQDKYGRDTLRACTILQVHTAKQSNEDFVIDGTEVGHISIVAQIRAVARRATGINYTLDDGTGSIDGLKFGVTDRPTHDEDGNPIPEPASEVALAVGSWVHVYGKLRQLGNNPKRTINIHGIKLITDMNEISHHLLEATYLHLYYTKGPPAGETAGAGDAIKQEDGLFVQQSGAGGDELYGVGANAKRMYHWIKKQPPNNEGYHAAAIAAGTGLLFNDVMVAADELLGTSKIFETLDDQTWSIQ